jgi:hypothetical protein
VSVQDRCMLLRKTYHRLKNYFCTHPMVLLGNKAQVDAHFIPFADSANLDSR